MCSTTGGRVQKKSGMSWLERTRRRVGPLLVTEWPENLVAVTCIMLEVPALQAELVNTTPTSWHK